MRRAARSLLLTFGLVLAAPTAAHGRRIVFAETWENGTAAWRTQRGNGVDCRSWPTCPFTATEMGATFPGALAANAIQVRDKDGAGGRDANTCSGKYVNVPRAYAGYDDASLAVTGGVTQGGVAYANSQFPVALGDRLCVVAWIRAWNENDAAAGPYVGINYAGPHGVINAAQSICSHYLVGPPPWASGDPEQYCARAGERASYGLMKPIVPDGLWHRYKQSFQVNAGDVADWNLHTPGLPGGTTWVEDNTVYGQPRLLLFGRPPERKDTPGYIPAIQHDADFGDIYVYRADDGVEDPCPTDAELDQIAWTSDHVVCAAGKTCSTSIAALPAGDRTPAQANNEVNLCVGCSASFGAAPPGQGVCAASAPFCAGGGSARAGTCKACSGDAASSSDPATRCDAASPTCLTEGTSVGSCGKCADNGACASPAHEGPTCDPTSGACFACTGDLGSATDKPCPASAPRCEPRSGLCTKCAWNDECIGHGGPYCDVASGQCTTCETDFGAPVAPTTCPAAFPMCLTAPMAGEPAGVCGECRSAADCVNPAGRTAHAGTMCDPATGACGKCDGDSGASNTAYACDQAAPTCRRDGNCARCTTYEDCTNPPGRRLHARGICNARTGACEGPEAEVPKCDADREIPSPLACDDSVAPVCGPDGMCAKCKADADCVNPPGRRLHARSVCDLATGACDQGPEAPVPPGPTVDSGGDDGGCSSAPSRSSGASLAAMGVVAAMLVGVRRKRRR